MGTFRICTGFQTVLEHDITNVCALSSDMESTIKPSISVNKGSHDKNSRENPVGLYIYFQFF